MMWNVQSCKKAICYVMSHAHQGGICDSKVHEANMGPIWGWHDPGGPNVGPMNFAIWDYMS